MSPRNALLIVATTLVIWGTAASAQETLGDLVASGGYDWIIGRWAATTDEGQKVEFNFEWALDKHAVLNSLRMGDLQYQGIITVSPTDQGAVDRGADSRGGTWKGAWSPAADGLVRSVEYLAANGRTLKGDMVFDKVDNDTITIAIYAVDDSGSRNSEPWHKLTYKRQPAAKTAPVSAAATTSRSTDYQTLGELVASGGYDWLIGKWVGNENNQTYEVEYKPILDKHAGTVDLKIGDFKYCGLIAYAASRQEVTEFGVDSLGRMWKMVWEPDGSGIITKSELVKPDGTTTKLQHVYTKIDNDMFNVKLYAVGADGSRGAEPREQVTFKRQKPAAPAK
jgi:hypothetical protein